MGNKTGVVEVAWYVGTIPFFFFFFLISNLIFLGVVV